MDFCHPGLAFQLAFLVSMFLTAVGATSYYVDGLSTNTIIEKETISSNYFPGIQHILFEWYVSGDSFLQRLHLEQVRVIKH